MYGDFYALKSCDASKEKKRITTIQIEPFVNLHFNYKPNMDIELQKTQSQAFKNYQSIFIINW